MPGEVIARMVSDGDAGNRRRVTRVDGDMDTAVDASCARRRWRDLRWREGKR